MKKLLFLTVILVCCSHAWADDLSDKPIIDEQFRETVLQLKEATNECRENEKNIIKKMKCGKKLREKYEKQGMIRGTDEYCKKHYSHLGYDELSKLWRELKQKRSIARIASPGQELVAGEVFEGMIMAEQHWVEFRLSQLQRERSEATEKKVFSESEKGRGQ